MEMISVRTLIVTYQIKYRDYLRNVQIERTKFLHQMMVAKQN